MSGKSLYNALCKLNQRRFIYISLLAIATTITFTFKFMDRYDLSTIQVVKANLLGVCFGTLTGLFVHYLRKKIISDESIAERYGQNYDGKLISFQTWGKQQHLLIIIFPILFIVTFVVGVVMKWIFSF